VNRYARWPIHLALALTSAGMLLPFYWVLKTSLSGDSIFATRRAFCRRSRICSIMSMSGIISRSRFTF
jgi:hypothetical protein